MDLDSSSDSSHALADAGLSAETVAAEPSLAPATPAKVKATPKPTPLMRGASVLKAALEWASRDITRFHLNGLCVDGASLVATDGHRLLKITGGGEGGGAPSFIVPREALLDACKLAGSKGVVEIGIPGPDDKGVLVVWMPGQGKRGEIAYKAISARFPPYMQVIPNITEGVDPTFPHTVNPLYLASMADVCVALDGKARLATHGIDLRSAGETLDPIAYTYDSKDGAVVTFVIMPMRGKASDWVDAARKARLATKKEARAAK